MNIEELTRRYVNLVVQSDCTPGKKYQTYASRLQLEKMESVQYSDVSPLDDYGAFMMKPVIALKQAIEDVRAARSPTRLLSCLEKLREHVSVAASVERWCHDSRVTLASILGV